jgi:hypothetical protein
MVKDPEEIKFLQKAIDITEAGFRRVLKFLKPGVGEWELEAEYLHEFVVANRGDSPILLSLVPGKMPVRSTIWITMISVRTVKWFSWTSELNMGIGTPT